MYGWEFFDVPERMSDWPPELSLSLRLASDPSLHTFYRCAECGREEDGDTIRYCIEGAVTFEDLLVLRADGTPIPLDAFAADGRRAWEALHARDERMSVEAQRTAQRLTPKWRPWPR
jgi:hypothetical protein